VERIKLILQLPPPQQAQQRQQRTAVVRPNAWQAARTVYTQEGVRSFWRGNGPSVLRTAGAAAVNFTCLDYYKGALLQPLLQEYYSPARAARRPRGRTDHAATPNTTPSPHPPPPPWLGSLLAGGLAGATSTTLFYPLEFARTRLALDHARHFRGTLHVMRTILLSRDGVRGLYQGFGVALAGGILYRLLHLGGYDAVKQQVLFRKSASASNNNSQRNSNNNQPQLLWWERLAVAQSVSLTAGILAYPLDSIRRRMMMQAGVPRDERLYHNAWHCVTLTRRHEGWAGFFRGVGPNVVRSIGGALLLVAYDTVRPLLGAAR
jgi:solute carrier family 25 (adenine nucleotide translocator) protein 4/5/6/31